MPLFNKPDLKCIDAEHIVCLYYG